MNLGIEHLILFLWVIGWILACGSLTRACENLNEPKRIEYYVVIFFLWPFYLGY